jgi:hypothetical protein
MFPEVPLLLSTTASTVAVVLPPQVLVAVVYL